MSESISNVTSALREQAGKILRLPFGLNNAAPHYPQCERVLKYWDELRANRVAPARDEIEPRRIATALEFTFVAELVAPQVARLRIAGKHLEDVLGMEPRGMPLGVFFTLDARAELGQALDQVVQGARAHLPIRAELGLGKPAMDGVLMLLPLTDNDGRITRILGVFETHGQIGRSPRRFRLTAPKAEIARPAASAPTPAPAVRPVVAVTSQHTPGMEPAAPQQASQQAPAPRGKPVLRLIQGGREG